MMRITPSANSGYVLHHNAPQYFGYLADNPAVLNTNLHGAKDFFDAVEGRKLPSDGGVFYLRGGYDNNDGLVPVDPTPAIEEAFIGNDDHPAYSDQQISEALAARAISDIAGSPYWSQSAIIITYDETDGYYDHVPPAKRSTFADGSILAAGPRIPTIVISPYAAAGTVSHQYSEHGSIIKFINELKGLAARPSARRGERSQARQDKSRPGQPGSVRRPRQRGRRPDRGVRRRQADGRKGTDSACKCDVHRSADQDPAASRQDQLLVERLHERRLRSDRRLADRLPLSRRLQERQADRPVSHGRQPAADRVPRDADLGLVDALIRSGLAAPAGGFRQP